MSIADFINANLDREESVVHVTLTQGFHADTDPSSIASVATWNGEKWVDVLSPALELDRIKALRKVVELHRHTPEQHGCCEGCDGVAPVTYMSCDVCVGPDYPLDGGWCSTLRAVASIWAGADDYREEWAL